MFRVGLRCVVSWVIWLCWCCVCGPCVICVMGRVVLCVVDMDVRVVFAVRLIMDMVPLSYACRLSAWVMSSHFSLVVLIWLLVLLGALPVSAGCRQLVRCCTCRLRCCHLHFN